MAPTQLQLEPGGLQQRGKPRWPAKVLAGIAALAAAVGMIWWATQHATSVPSDARSAQGAGRPDATGAQQPGPPQGAAAVAETGDQPVTPLGDGLLVGRVVNALSNSPVPNAQVRIAATRLGTQTDDAGYFRLAGTPTGTVSLQVSADGFSAEQFQRELPAGQETSVRVALSPRLEKGQIRIVLTWGREPKDLDAHLEGPLPENQRFHVYYHQPGDLKSREFVRLDTDAQQGEGPETITVLGVLPGVYRYFVHDYSNRDHPQSTALANSGAEVTVYQGGESYQFHAGHDMAGNLWDVCTLEVTPTGAVVKKTDQYQAVEVETLGLYAKRTMADREQWIGRYGGSTISEQAVADGLDWLVRHQAPDGSWSNRCLGSGSQSRCSPADRCQGEGDTYEMAQTGLALLALQAGGHYYFNDTKYSAAVRKGLDWIVEHQRIDGALLGSQSSGKKGNYHKYYMYEHGIAAFAVADACAAAAALYVPENEKYIRAAERAVAFIEKNQHDDGGWRYTPERKAPSDTSVTGWPMLALKSAKEAGIPSSTLCVEKMRKFFEEHQWGSDGRTGYQRRSMTSDATTGVGMLARQFILDEPDAPLVADAAKYLAERAEARWGDRAAATADRDYYLWYNCTLAMFQVGGELWNRWNSRVRDTIIALQRHEGCQRGSWDPNDRWGSRGGRIYSTALAILTLEVYYRYTPQGETHQQFELRGGTPGGHESAAEGQAPTTPPTQPRSDGAHEESGKPKPTAQSPQAGHPDAGTAGAASTADGDARAADGKLRKPPSRSKNSAATKKSSPKPRK